MRDIFQRHAELSRKLADEWTAQHERLCKEKADAEVMIENLSQQHGAVTRMIDEHARNAKERVAVMFHEQIEFQRRRIAAIDEQLKTVVEPTAEAA